MKTCKMEIRNGRAKDYDQMINWHYDPAHIPTVDSQIVLSNNIWTVYSIKHQFRPDMQIVTVYVI